MPIEKKVAQDVLSNPSDKTLHVPSNESVNPVQSSATLLSSSELSILLNYPDIKSKLSSSSSLGMAFRYINDAEQEEEALERLSQVMKENQDFAEFAQVFYDKIDKKDIEE